MAFNYGGQAVIEGVMIRGQKAVAVAVRKPEGAIITHSEPLNSALYKSSVVRLPFVRGVVALYDMLGIGMRMLMFSAAVATGAEDEQAAMEQVSGQNARLQMGVALAVGVATFFVAPLALINAVDRRIKNSFLSNLAESAVRVGIFLTYLQAISQIPDIRRVFAYHGAEHKAVHAHEAGDPLVTERVQAYPTAHPRCGTAFLLQVMMVSSVVFSLFGRPSLPVRLLARLGLVPVIASISYELLRFGARRQDAPLVRAMIAPGLLLQRLTTREPDDAQVEVAITAMSEALRLDREAADGAAPSSGDGGRGRLRPVEGGVGSGRRGGGSNDA
jgi:uncharacterized protein YqhQ